MAFAFTAASGGPAGAGGAPERLFVALWPDAATRDRLDEAAGKLATGGRRVAAANLHLTLAFLGAVGPERQALVVEAIRDARGEAFDLLLDSSGRFSASRAVWLGTSAPPPALLAMQQRLAANLRGAGFKLEERRFAPHITLARDAVKAPAGAVDGVLPIPWQVRQLALVRSRPGRAGSHYEVVESVALQTGVEGFDSR